MGRETREALYVIPEGEKMPFGLFRTLSWMGGKLGFREIAIDMAAGKEKGTPDPQPLHFTMKFEARFEDCMTFMRKLAALKRYVCVEGVLVERDDAKVPFQRVSLSMVAYSWKK